MDRRPALRGKLLELRPVRSDDFDALYVVASDPLVWEQHPARDRHEESIFRTFFRDAKIGGVRVPSRPDQRDPASVVYRLNLTDQRAR